jgi:hypothetical protein
MPPDFLNSREDAILLWTLALLCFVTYKDAGWLRLAWEPIRVLFGSKLFLVFGFAALYSGAIVLLAQKLRLWHTSSLKETVYWFVGSAVVLVSSATSATPGWQYLRDILSRALSLTLLIAFLVNFYVFPLGYELVLLFLIAVFTMGRAAAPLVPNSNQTVRIMDRALGVIGLYLLVTFAVRAAFDPGGLFTQQTAERFFVVPILTLALVPYLLAVAWYCRREVESVRRQVLRASI